MFLNVLLNNLLLVEYPSSEFECKLVLSNVKPPIGLVTNDLFGNIFLFFPEKDH